ncbi:hypothetical protein R5R35_006641 [Gryllus longicercus]|uniref:Major facilitator superfamily (MFS) profile domain-containing protein n=1 Tax=Gryllus longicercus TaxID=2509291 RepID=A0AAN9VCA0_9ORTH
MQKEAEATTEAGSGAEAGAGALEAEGPAWRRRLAQLRASRRLQVALVYASLLLDNVLLTVVVPILPDYLHQADYDFAMAAAAAPARPSPRAAGAEGPATVLLVQSEAAAAGAAPPNCSHGAADRRDLSLVAPAAGGGAGEALLSESSRVGLLLASKALVQLLCNPLVGLLTSRVGSRVPQLLGSASLLAAALAFAVGQSFVALLMARSLQGVASACVGVSGMSLVAELFPGAAARSRVMGAVLGAAATGVLLGYPLGGALYQLSGGKAAPFLLLAALLLLLTVMQLACLSFKSQEHTHDASQRWHHLLTDGRVLITAGAILVSTSAMAILEPCLPIWLMDTIKPQKWQLGTVFFPDSLGYLLGTNCFGLFAYRLGPWKVAVAALLLVGISALLIPTASAISQLVIPHFGLGLGIGVTDAALVPFLANLVDTHHAAHYGSVYSLEQTAVSLAYFLGPFAGGELVETIGFSWLMRIVGLLNILYCPLLFILIFREARQTKKGSIVDSSTWLMNYQSNVNTSQSKNFAYKQFTDASDSE